MSVRVWLPVPNPYNPKNPWDDLALAYYKAINEVCPSVRPMTYTFGDLGDKDSPWKEIANHFVRPMVDKYDVNIVIGTGAHLFDKFYTEHMFNIAITGVTPLSEHDKIALRRWEVWHVHDVKPEDVKELLK